MLLQKEFWPTVRQHDNKTTNSEQTKLKIDVIFFFQYCSKLIGEKTTLTFEGLRFEQPKNFQNKYFGQNNS